MGKHRYNKLNKNHSQQKHTVRIGFNENKLCHPRPLFRSLNIYQINLFQHLKVAPVVNLKLAFTG